MVKFAIFLAFCFVCCTSSSVKWPKWAYTLVKPYYGCPPGWYQGWTFQDNEDSANKNYISYGHHFAGTFDDGDFKFYYCTKTTSHSDSGNSWPRGNYCILKAWGYGCPWGFNFGSVFWDDEDLLNANYHGGTVPSGSFGRDTRINYCCRNDGYYYNAIELPTADPFYLLRYDSYCQRVKGMHVREEIVRFDDEDIANRNSVSGSYPLGADREDRLLLYCYYWQWS